MMGLISVGDWGGQINLTSLGLTTCMLQWFQGPKVFAGEFYTSSCGGDHPIHQPSTGTFASIVNQSKEAESTGDRNCSHSSKRSVANQRNIPTKIAPSNHPTTAPIQLDNDFSKTIYFFVHAKCWGEMCQRTCCFPLSHRFF